MTDTHSIYSSSVVSDTLIDFFLIFTSCYSGCPAERASQHSPALLWTFPPICKLSSDSYCHSSVNFTNFTPSDHKNRIAGGNCSLVQSVYLVLRENTCHRIIAVQEIVRTSQLQMKLSFSVLPTSFYGKLKLSLLFDFPSYVEISSLYR
jgi:hypothetical protein